MSIKVTIGSSAGSNSSNNVIDDSPEHYVASSPSALTSSEVEDRVNIAFVGKGAGPSPAYVLKTAFGRFVRQMKLGGLLLNFFVATRDHTKKLQLLAKAVEYADDGIEILLDEIRRFGLNEKRLGIFNEIYGQRMAILSMRFKRADDFNLMIKCADLLRKAKSFEEFIQGHQLENSKLGFVPLYEGMLAEFVEVLAARFYRELYGSSSVVDPTTIYMYLKIVAGKSSLKSTRAVAEKVLLDFVKFMVANGDFEQAAKLIDANRDILVSGKAADMHLKMTFEEFVKLFEEVMPKRIALVLDATGKNEAALNAAEQCFRMMSEAIMASLRMAPAKQAIAVFDDAPMTKVIQQAGLDVGGFGRRSTAFKIVELVTKYFSALAGVDLKVFEAEVSANSYFTSLCSKTVGSPLKLGGYVFLGVRPAEFRAPVLPDSGLVVTNIEHRRGVPQPLLEELRCAEREFSMALGRVNRVRLRFEKK